MKALLKTIVLLIPIFFTSCRIADISQSTTLSPSDSERIAQEKIEETILVQGFASLQKQNVYSFTATDYWPGLLGGIAKIWPDKKTKFLFQHNFNTFDGRALFLDGKKEGDEIGVQSWIYYEKAKEKGEIENLDTGSKQNKLEFGMVVFHYFLELPFRLKSAPVKRYYGEASLRGNTYDLVFASWGSEAPNKDHDQYILWINRESKLVDYCVYTLRDNTNPLTRHKYGSIAFQEYKNENGFQVPTVMPIFLDDGVIKRKTLDKYFHRFNIHEFSLGGFEEARLYPLPDLEKQLDYK